MHRYFFLDILDLKNFLFKIVYLAWCFVKFILNANIIFQDSLCNEWHSFLSLIGCNSSQLDKLPQIKNWRKWNQFLRFYFLTENSQISICLRILTRKESLKSKFINDYLKPLSCHCLWTLVRMLV